MSNSNIKTAGVAGTAALSYIYVLIQTIVQLAYIPILLRLIGQDEYGLYQLVGSILAYLVSMTPVFSGGVTRFYCKYLYEGDDRGVENLLATCSRLCLVASGIILVAGLALSAAVQVVYRSSLDSLQLREASLMLLVMSANLVVTLYNTISVAVINGSGHTAFLRVTQIASALLQPALVIVAGLFLPYAAVICFAQFIVNAACAVIQGRYSRVKLGARRRFHGWDLSLIRELAAYELGVLGIMLGDQIFWRSNQLVIGYYFGTAAVAVYSVGFQVLNAYLQIGTAVQPVFMPMVSRLYFKERDEPGINRLLAKSGRVIMYPLALVLTGFIVFGRQFIGIWAGPGYGDAYIVATALMIAYLPELSQFLTNPILQVKNQYSFKGKADVFFAIINLLISMLVVPCFGGSGAAISTAAIVWAFNLVLLRYYRNAAGIDIGRFLKGCSRVLAPLAALCVVSWALVSFTSLYAFTESSTGLLLGIVAYCLAFAIVSWLFCANQYEKGLVVRALKKLTCRFVRRV